MNGFLPINRKDMEERGWTQVDFAYVIADAYVDHSSFGPAIRMPSYRGCELWSPANIQYILTLSRNV